MPCGLRRDAARENDFSRVSTSGGIGLIVSTGPVYDDRLRGRKEPDRAAGAAHVVHKRRVVRCGKGVLVCF